MRRLLLIRHSKSSHKFPNLSDHDRPLNKRGDRDRFTMANYLFDKEENLQTVFSSSATRSFVLAETISRQLKVPLKTNSELYTFNSQCLLNCIYQLPNHLHTIAVVGHNPAITVLVNQLCNESIINVPTSGVVALNCDESTWSDVTKAEIDYFVYPKMLS